MFYFHLILSLCVVASCNQDGEWFKCKPKPGCSIARCDPRPAGQWFGNDGLDNDYPILCQQNEAPSSTTVDTENVNKFDEIRTELAKLVGRLERSEKVEFQMNSEMTLMAKKNAETESGLRNEMEKVKKEVEEGKTKFNGAMKQIDLLKKQHAKMEKDAKVKTEDLIKRIVSLENNIGGEKKGDGGTTEGETSTIAGNKFVTKSALCPMIYDNKCFIAVIGRKVNYDGGVAICESLGSQLANIYSQIHMDGVMKYIRENRLGGSSWKRFFLGMKYNPKANKLTLRDGSDAPAGLKWNSGYPYTVEARGEWVADYTNVILNVRSDQSSTSQYLFNAHPSHTYHVLCEIE